MSHVAQEPGPHLFLCKRLAADVSRDFGVGPHCGAVRKIVQAMRSQPEALGFKDGDFYSGEIGARHRCSLFARAHHVKRAREHHGPSSRSLRGTLTPGTASCPRLCAVWKPVTIPKASAARAWSASDPRPALPIGRPAENPARL